MRPQWNKDRSTPHEARLVLPNDVLNSALQAKRRGLSFQTTDERSLNGIW